MPHIIVKMYTGRTEEQKRNLCKAIAQAVSETTGAPDSAISIGIEEFSPEEWPEKVYKPDILDKEDYLFKKPGYNPFK